MDIAIALIYQFEFGSWCFTVHRTFSATSFTISHLSNLVILHIQTHSACLYDGWKSLWLRPYFHSVICLFSDDHNRVLLTNAKNDYINASYINDLSPTTPPFIATQAPVTSAINDFWLMVYEQQITIIAALIADPPVGVSLEYGSILITLGVPSEAHHPCDNSH